MGTNFYWADTLNDGDPHDPAIHVGKRSAAGSYCWNCRTTLCMDGEAAIHQHRPRFHAACPGCGGVADTEIFARGSMAVELGFARPELERPTGVTRVSSFSWAQEPSVVRSRCGLQADTPVIRDEYGRTYTGREFLRMLACNCPIEFTRHIGKWFS